MIDSVSRLVLVDRSGLMGAYDRPLSLDFISICAPM